MSDPWSWLWLLAAVAAWIGVCLLLALMSGWTALASQYRAQQSFHGHKWYLRTGRLRLIRYRGMLTVGVSDAGLYLAVLFLSRIGHPPLLIPWQHVRKGQETWMGMVQTLHLGEAGAVPLKIGLSLLADIEKALGRTIQPS